jgi:hypothetical protein
MLSLADTGEETKVLEWCSYVLEGLRVEIEKIDKLLDLRYITQTILLPMLAYAREKEHITAREHGILTTLILNKNMSIKSSDLDRVIGEESPVQRSRILKKLKDKLMIIPLKPNGRVYTIGFVNNYLMRGVMHVLEKNNFIPSSLNHKN